MKKKMALLMTLLFGVASQADLIDDFDSYDISASTNVIDIESSWVAVGDSENVDIIDDGTGNQVITYGYSSGGAGMYKPEIGAVADTSSASTLFARVYVANEDLDHSFGLSDEAAPSWFSGFEVQIVLGRNSTEGTVDLKGRSSGSVVNITTINVGQWYNIWAVIDQTSDTYSMYLTTGEEGATSSDLIQEGLNFRNGTTADLTTFLAFSYYAVENGLYIDEVYLLDGVDLNYPLFKPYDPAVDQVANDNGKIDISLSWKAGIDPEGIEAINPDIVNEYVFVGQDPNIYCLGSVGDPGTTTPGSTFEFEGEFDTEYTWVVVDALDTMTQTISVGDLLSDVTDPNAITSPRWKFDSLMSSATISQQPSDIRVFTTDASASFTVEYSSLINPVTSVVWYKDGAPLSEGGDISITSTLAAGEGESTLTIATPELSDEASYYCIVNTDSDASVTTDDTQSATRLLVIKQLLSKYTFDNAADPLADTGELAAEVGVSRDAAKVMTLDLETLDTTTATEVTPTILTDGGIQGSALYLDGDEYVDLSTLGYPRAGDLNTVGDIRGEGYEKQGFGRGMDAGSIICWVKVEVDGVVTGNANIEDGLHYALAASGTNSARIIVRGENWEGGWQNLGDATGAYDFMEGFSFENGQWDMLAATWENSTVNIYINGELVASNTQGYTEVYTPWDLGNLIGASRQGQPDRHLLNGDSILTGAIDELSIYNYPISAEDIVAEYSALNEFDITPCLNHNFAGIEANLDNTVSSYCVVDLLDFAVMANSWLSDGFDAE